MALNTEEKKVLRGEFAQHDNDTGSVELQVALLTENILKLTEHCRTHAKDFSTRRGLLNMVARRKKFLDYLKVSDEKTYKTIVERLKLKHR